MNSKYEARLRRAAFWAEVRLWGMIAAIICLPTALVIWVLTEFYPR